jgi:Family of unknown function (DUF5994)
MRLFEPRLAIARRPTRRDHLHGAWWPHSSDLDQELAPMLTLVAARFGAVLGVMLNREEWPDVALAGQLARTGKTKISWYGLAESHQMVLLCGQSRRLALLVLPPETPEPVALTATLMACAPGNALTTDETLARARAEAPSRTAG